MVTLAETVKISLVQGHTIAKRPSSNPVNANLSKMPLVNTEPRVSAIKSLGFRVQGAREEGADDELVQRRLVAAPVGLAGGVARGVDGRVRLVVVPAAQRSPEQGARHHGCRMRAPPGVPRLLLHHALRRAR